MPWKGKGQPTPVFLAGESHGQRSMVGYSPLICKESDTTEQLSNTCFQGLCPENSGLPGLSAPSLSSGPSGSASAFLSVLQVGAFQAESWGRSRGPLSCHPPLRGYCPRCLACSVLKAIFRIAYISSGSLCWCSRWLCKSGPCDCIVVGGSLLRSPANTQVEILRP